MNCFTYSFYSVKCTKIKFLVSLEISCFIDHDISIRMEPSAPPSYNDAAHYHNRLGVTVSLQPTGYVEQSDVVSSITPGGLRLDKAKKIGNRLVIDFEKHACCPFTTTGLDPDCKNYVPEELRIKGITQGLWVEWCEELMKVQKKSPSISGCLCVFCFPGLFVQGILCAVFCPTSGDHCLKCLPCFYGDWHAGLGKWQRKVNEVLNKKDMHAKLKTYKPHNK